MGCHFLLRGIFLTQGSIEPMSPASAGGFFTTKPPSKPIFSRITFSSQQISGFHLGMDNEISCRKKLVSQLKENCY